MENNSDYSENSDINTEGKFKCPGCGEWHDSPDMPISVYSDSLGHIWMIVINWKADPPVVEWATPDSNITFGAEIVDEIIPLLSDPETFEGAVMATLINAVELIEKHNDKANNANLN